MQKSTYRILSAAYVCILLVCGLVSTLFPQNAYVMVSVTVVYELQIIQWTILTYWRVVNAKVRRLLLLISINMFFLFTLRAMEYVFFKGNPVAERYLWYSFYMPVIVIPLMTFFVTLEADKPEREKRNRLWNLLYVLAALLSLGFLTNDLHGLAFSVQQSVVLQRADSHKNILYDITMIWTYAFLILSFLLMIRRCQISSTRKKVWIPLMPVIAGGLYLVFYYFRVRQPVPFELPEIICFMIVGFLEGFIHIGIIPSNEDYDRLFAHSGMLAEIVREDGEIIHTSQFFKRLTTEQIRRAVTEPVMLDNNTCLHSLAIYGGYVCWADDLTTVNQMIDRMNDLREKLQDEQTILEAENELRTRKARAQERDQLYQTVSKSITPQLNTIRQLLDEASDDAVHRKAIVARAGIYQAYIKRRCNLALLAAENPTLHLFEVVNSIWESLDFLKLNGILCSLVSKGNQELKSRQAVLLYDLFEAVTEETLPGLSALFLHLESSEERLVFKLAIEGEIRFSRPWREELLQEQKGTLEWHEEDGVQYVHLKFLNEGEKQERIVSNPV